MSNTTKMEARLYIDITGVNVEFRDPELQATVAALKAAYNDKRTPLGRPLSKQQAVSLSLPGRLVGLDHFAAPAPVSAHHPRGPWELVEVALDKLAAIEAARQRLAALEAAPVAATYLCAGSRHGCRAQVKVRGAMCPRCEHDA